MLNRYRFIALASFVGLGASLGCSAQGDQPDTGLGANGAGGNSGSSNGGAAVLGGTSSTTNGGTSTIPTGGTMGTSGTPGAGGTQGGIQCVGTGARLKGVLRDFQPNVHPDFEPHMTKPTASTFYNMIERGIVQPRISDEVNRKPVYAGGPNGTNTTIGPAYFPSWFLDTPNANVSVDFYLDFVESPTTPGLYVFDKAPFLPVDDGALCPFMPQTPCLLGNSTNYPTHNYALTFEFHTRFVYKPGMRFTFSGDDDVWVFVHGQLVIDLGGIHTKTDATIELDQLAGPLGLTPDSEYILDFFWAERHVTQSNFRIETSLDFIGCSIDVPK